MRAAFTSPAVYQTKDVKVAHAHLGGPRACRRRQDHPDRRLLFEAGVLAEPGSVDAGSTHTDTMALERRRGITIRAAVVSFDVHGTTVNLVDTPGHSDFIAEVERSLNLLDGAVLVVSAVEGVQAQTLVLMRALQRLGIATVVFVNKVDRPGADPEFVELEVRDRLDADVPVLFGSALKGQGCAALLNAVPELLPTSRTAGRRAPVGPGLQDRPGRLGRQGVRRGPARRHAPRSRPPRPGARRPAAGHAAAAFIDGGLEAVSEAVAGQVVALRGLDAARVGDGFGDGPRGRRRSSPGRASVRSSSRSTSTTGRPSTRRSTASRTRIR